MDTGLDERVRALDEGRAYVRPHARALRVSGGEASRWLNDLVTAGVAELADGAGVRSLVLSPTGRIRADVHVVPDGGAFVLVQGLDQPEAIDAILAPYVLSSDVQLRSADRVPVLGAGVDGWHAVVEPAPGMVEVDAPAGERWRIEHSIAAFPVDLDADSLPAEAGLDVPPVTDIAKGCFLGQESVARVRNLGHPTRVVLPVAAEADVAAGELVVADGAGVGVVTSAAAIAPGRFAALVRVRWGARTAAFRTARGVELTPR